MTTVLSEQDCTVNPDDFEPSFKLKLIVRATIAASAVVSPIGGAIAVACLTRHAIKAMRNY